MKIRTIYAALTICLSVSPAALGQTPQTQHNRGGGSANPGSPPPEYQAAIAQAGILAHTAAASLHAGNYSQAEAEARKALSLNHLDGVAEEVLAAALYAQGKDQEALQTYKFIVEHMDYHPRNLLPYAQLLLKSGQWKQAVTLYNEVLPSLADGDLMRANSHFSPDVPKPAELEVVLHIARGLSYNGECDWSGEYANDKALAEYGKALQLAPNSDLANYYYGYGWQRLSPTEKTKLGSAAQAKAALQKAVKLGKGDVKKAAEKALLVAMNTK